MKILFVFSALMLVLTSLALVAAQNSVSMNKSTYQVGDTITACITTDGGTVTLVLSGPYTENINLGTVPSGSFCVPIGQAEQRDLGSWNVAMYVTTSVPFIPGSTSPSATTYYNVESATPEFFNTGLVVVATLVASLLFVAGLGRGRKAAK